MDGQDDESTALPLAGIRVVDVATVIAAPYCAAILGEFGAEVIKVEHPVGGDPCRRFGTPSCRTCMTIDLPQAFRPRKAPECGRHSPMASRRCYDVAAHQS